MATFQDVLGAIYAERAPSSRKNFECALKAWQRATATEFLSATPDLVRTWQTREKQRLKSTTLSLYWTLLEMLWDSCHEAGIAPQQNPFRSPFAGRKPDQRSEAQGQRAISPEDLELILTGFDTDTWIGRRNRLATMLLFLAGLRACEVCALNAEDLVMHDGTISLLVYSPKTKRREPQVVPERLQQELVYWTAEIDPAGPLFPGANFDSTPGEGRLLYRRLLEALKKACKRVGYAYPLGTHSGRATVATRALESGAKPRDVMHYLRHRDLSTTLRYDRGRSEAQTRVAKIF